MRTSSVLLVSALALSPFSALAGSQVIVSSWNASPVRTQAQAEVADCVGRNPIGTWDVQFTPGDGHGSSSQTKIAVSRVKISAHGTQDFKVEEQLISPANPQLPVWLQKGLFDGDPRAQLIVFNGCTLVGKKSNGDVDWGFTAFGHGRIEEGSKLIWGSLGSGNGIAMVRVEAPAAKAKKSACSN